MKYGMIKLAGERTVRKLCRVFSVACSAYYTAQKKAEQPRAKDKARFGQKTRELFEASERTCGSPRLTEALQRHRRNFSDEVETRKEAALVAAKLNASDAQVLTLTTGDHQSYLEAKRLLAPLAVPLHDAIRDYMAARTLLQDDALLPAIR